MTEITILVDEHGNTLIDVEGAEGRQCVELLKPLVESIGKVETEKKKPSYYQEANRTQQVHLSQ